MGLTPDQQKLVTAHEHLIPPEVVSALRSAPWAERDDLYQEGQIGLIYAAKATTRKADKPFAPFARRCIHNQIRNSDAYTRGVGADRTLLAIVAYAIHVLLERGIHRPTAEEIAAETKARGRPYKVGDVERALLKLALASKESIEKLTEEGREVLEPGEPPARIAPRNWGPTWERMVAGVALAVKMSADDKRAFVDHLTGMSDKRIAAKLKIREGTLRTRLSRLRDDIEACVVEELAKIGARRTLAAILCRHVGLTPGGEFESLDPGTRRAALADRAKGAGVELPEEVMAFLVDHIRGTAPGLEDLLDQALTRLFEALRPPARLTIEAATAALRKATVGAQRALLERADEELEQLGQLRANLRRRAGSAGPAWLLDLVEIVVMFLEGREAT